MTHHIEKSCLLLLWCILSSTQSQAWAQMSADEELKTLDATEPFEVSLFAAEPMITNPAAIDIDTQGRVWVAEIQYYRRKAKTDPPQDKIKVLEDTNGDGKADKVTVFAEHVFCPMSICVAGDKVYVATSPDLWVYEDADGDLRADGPPKKLLTGFGGYNHDHGAHSLVLGPDHKWWMSHGDGGFNVTGADGSHIAFKWGAMLRGELDGTKLETVAVNFRNPYEICVNSFGEAYCSDNDNDGNESVRICWILEGGNYGWFGGPPFRKNEVNTRVPLGTPYRESWHFRSFQPGYVPATFVTGFGSPCGICFNEGNAFGNEYKNTPIHADAGPRLVRAFPHQESGFGKLAKSKTVLSTTGDDYFRPDDVCVAPDGSMYVSDWYDGGVGGHAYNDPTRGRIFVLRPKGKELKRREKPGPYTSLEDAIQGLKSPNLATQYLAREFLLAEGNRSVSALANLLWDSDPNYRARALWVLDRIGGEGRQVVVDQLGSNDDKFRALAIRILRRHGAGITWMKILAKANDPSILVRREVLLSIPTMTDHTADVVLLKAARQFDGSDRYLLEIIRIAATGREDRLARQLTSATPSGGELSNGQVLLLQAINPNAAKPYVVAGLRNSSFDLATTRTLLATAENEPDLDMGRALLKMVANKNTPAQIRSTALAKLSVGLNMHWQALRDDSALTDVLRSLLNNKEFTADVLEFIGRTGIKTLDQHVLAIIHSDDVASDLRVLALRTASRSGMSEMPDVVFGLLKQNEKNLQQAALRAFVTIEDRRVIEKLLSDKQLANKYADKLVDMLMRSNAGPRLLLPLVEEGSISGSLRERVVADAAKHPDSNVRALYAQFIPVDQRPERLGESVSAKEILSLKGNAKRGEQIFYLSSAAQCNRCHTIAGRGKDLGPELTRIGRKYERGALLETILEPSKAIAPEFIPYVVQTKRGQVYIGYITERNDDKVIIRDAQNKRITIATSDVEEITSRNISIMPDLVLRDVTAQDAADLLEYLTTLK